MIPSDMILFDLYTCIIITNQDGTRPDHGSDQGSDHGPDHGWDYRKKNLKKIKISKKNFTV